MYKILTSIIGEKTYIYIDIIKKYKSGASGSRCIGFSGKEAGRPFKTTRN